MDLVDDIEEPGLFVGITLAAPDAARASNLAQSMALDIPDALVELLRRALPPSNGHGFPAICDHCRLPYAALHKPRAGVGHYCNRLECKKEAAAERARRFRERRTAE